MLTDSLNSNFIKTAQIAVTTNSDGVAELTDANTTRKILAAESNVNASVCVAYKYSGKYVVQVYNAGGNGVKANTEMDVTYYYI